MKKATYGFIFQQLLSKNEKEHMMKVFHELDANGDGTLSREEVRVGYGKYFGIVVDEEELDALFNSIDIDGSGKIEYSEFVLASMNEQQLLSEDRLKQAFAMFDKDGSGFIDADEVKATLGFSKSLNEDAVNKLIEEVDQNHDKKISFEEFANMMRKLAAAEVAAPE